MQALNLGILLVALVYFVKKSIVEFFFQRQVEFNIKSQKTAMALKQAELELKEIKEKMALLESTQSSSVQAAETEADKVKNKLIQEARAQAEKIKIDVSLVISAEVYKAKNEIRNQIIEKSIITARDVVRGSARAVTEKSEKGFISDLGRVKA